MLWTERLGRGRFGDQRLATRVRILVAAIVAHAEASLPQIFPCLRELKAASACFSNPRVSPAAILSTDRPGCLAALAAGETVLMVQDTTALTWAHPATAGLGRVSRYRHQRGMLAHTALAVRPDGVALGSVAQALWERDPAQTGQRYQRRQRATAAKESQRWQETELASLVDIPPTVHAITVADREADIFALFAAPRPAHADLLIRAAHDRVVTVDDERRHLWAAVEAAPVLGCHPVAVQRAQDRDAREAYCRLRVCRVQLQPPQQPAPGTPQQAPLALTALLLQEVGAPPHTVPLCWLLLTTLPVPDLVAAGQCVQYYTLRWLVERYHFVLKTGCGVEQLQLQHADRLERAVAVYCLVAWRVLGLTYQGRETPAAPCDTVLQPAEWETLTCLHDQTPTPRPTPPSLGEAVQWIAQLGGFLARRGDGEPGPRTVWRGYTRLREYVVARQLFLRSPPVTP